MKDSDRDYLMSISIKPRVRGNTESRTVLETKFLPPTEAIEQANEAINHKFGSGESIGLFRERRHRREIP